MTNKIEITEYDKPKARWYFVLFKFLELFGLFLFTFGFYGFGCLVIKYCPWFYKFSIISIDSCTSYLCIWFTGFVALLCVCCLLFLGGFVLWVIYQITKSWIKGNWNLAKRVAESKEQKKKRLDEEELAQKKADRKRWEYCVGDEAKYICEETDADNKKRFGQKCKILWVNKYGNINPEWEDGTTGGRSSTCVDYSSFKITKKQKLK